MKNKNVRYIMMKLKLKLSIFNLLTKLAFIGLFLILMPFIIERINLTQVDNDLIQKREQVISQIGEIGIEPFITSDSSDAFGSYNILKEEFISLERINSEEDWNFIEVTTRLIEGEEIDYRVLNYTFLVDNQKYLLEVGKSLTSIQNTARNIRKVMLLVLLFIVISTFAIDVQYSTFLLRPLDKITNKLKLISEPSSFDKRPVETKTADFVQLDNALLELMEHIDRLFKKERDITINISHELLTPISVLRSKLENLLLQKDLDPDITDKVDESLNTLHRLQGLVNSLLLIARIENHQYIREESFSIKEVLTEIISEIKPVAVDAGISIKDEIVFDYLIVKANRPLIFSMLYNVINNAVKHSFSSGEVIIRSEIIKTRFTVTISDSGIGLTPEQIETLFSRFKMRNKTSGEGTGIGLAIAKTIADFHQIEITVTSLPGQGTKFSFIFPEIS